MTIKYFSMFSGIGGFELGIERAYNHKHEPKKSEQTIGESRRERNINEQKLSFCSSDNTPLCVGYSEINKYAIQVYESHFGGHKNYGDATKINPNELPDFDMLCGGFPCQAFSIAGKRRGFEDTRGTLFFDIARIIEAKRPSYILLENVKGLLSHNKGQTFSIIINTIQELGYDVEWMVLNSKFFGVPQNRERVFIIGSLTGERRPEILPISECIGETKELVYAQKSDREIARVYSSEGIAPTLHLKTGGWQEPKIAIRVQGDLDKRKTYLSEEVGTLSANPTSDNLPRVTIMDLYNHKEHTDRTPTLTEPHHNSIRLQERNLKIRKLTPTECARLQGFPDDWCKGLSDTQQYKCYGNAVTTNVIEAIMNKISSG